MNLIKPIYAVIENPALKNPSGQSSPDYISNVIQTLFGIFMVVGVIYFVWHFLFAGYHFISARGDEKAYAEAKNEVTYSLIGLGAVFSVFAVLKLIGAILGIQGLDSLQISLPSL